MSHVAMPKKRRIYIDGSQIHASRECEALFGNCLQKQFSILNKKEVR